jgi:hypothetical protein
MSDPLRLLTVLAEVGSTYADRRRPRGAGGTTLLTLSAVATGISALAFAFAAIWIFAVPIVGPASAALIVAALLLVLSLASLLASRRPLSSRPDSGGVTAGDIGLILNSAADVVRQHKPDFLLAAFLAGLLAGETKTSSGPTGATRGGRPP